MSLVNKMLRDLDARRAGDAERGVLPTAVTPIEADGTSSRRAAVLLTLAVLVVGGIAAIAGFLPTFDTPSPAAITQSPQRTLMPATGYAAAPTVSTSPADSPSPAAIVLPHSPTAAVPSPQPPVAASSAADPVATAEAPRETASLADIANASLKLDASLMALPPAAPKRQGASAAPAAKPSPSPLPLEAMATSARTATILPQVAAVAPIAKSPPATAELARPAAAAPEGKIEKHERKVSPAEKAEAEYRRGQIAQRQGSTDEAMARYRQALVDSVEHIAARQSLAGLLIERRRFDEAEEVLRGGRALFPLQPHWPMTLARLKVERGDAAAALDILQKQAVAGEASADFQGFHGALLQRAGRAGEAAEHYAAATRLAPNEARWWAGMGIALEGAGRPAEARSAYERARSLPGLPAELAAHVEQRLGVR